MKIKLLATLLFAGVFSFSYGQPDLIITNTSIYYPTSIQSSGLFTFYCTVRNQGNVASTASHVRCVISTTGGSINEVFGIDVSVEGINAFSNSKLITAQISLPNSLTSGYYYIWYQADNRYEVTETNGANNDFQASGNLIITQNAHTEQNIAYPIIFIHGVNDDDKCWAANKTASNNGPGYTKTLKENFGWSFGGSMGFCLNSDNFSTYYGNDITDFVNQWPALKKGDYYYVSFDVDPSGNDYNSTLGVQNGDQNYLSNQSAIRKQGIAIYYAVQHVLNVTGKDKVILAGHSMGGLAAMEYIRSSYYQNDVAKYFSTGTPHGGSNSVTLGQADCKSEAYRDLRYSYSNTNMAGVFLLGDGTGGNQLESYSVMDNSFCGYFYDIDVDCNGNSGDYIKGLDYRPLTSSIYYSCAIGFGSSAGGDGCVAEARADLNKWNTSGISADTIMIETPGYLNLTVLHQHLPSAEFSEANTRGLDEPNTFNLAYGIDTGQIYFGNITKKSNWYNTGGSDHDWYKFTAPSSGIINLQVSNIPVNNFLYAIYDQSLTVVDFDYNYGSSNINKQIIIPQGGQYYLDLNGSPDMDSWKNPYMFSLSGFSSTTSVKEFSNEISDIMNSPNPFHDRTNISFTLNQSVNISLKVYNALGETVATLLDGRVDAGKHFVEFDGSKLTSGLYYYTLQSENYFKSGKMVLEK